jgi:hypothetical protein
MNGNKKSRVRQSSECGQTLVLVPLLLLVMLSFCAFTIDLGNVYLSYEELVSDTNAAALAGGAGIEGGTATANADLYSGKTSPVNYRKTLNVTAVAVSTACVSTTTYPNLKLPDCVGTPSANVVQVKETALVPTYFAKIFGYPTVTLNAVATASARGGGAPPYNIMVVMDSTASMGMGVDTGCVTGSSSGYSPEQCAQFGVQTLLGELDPCANTLSSCTGATPVDQVGVMTFPGICSAVPAAGYTPITTSNCVAATTAQTGTTLSNTTANATYAPDDTQCPAKNPPIAEYNDNPEYLILGFNGNTATNEFRTSDTSGLNTNSPIFQSVNAGTTGCGIQTPGGEGTFYAGIIIAAQQYLAAYSKVGTQNVMIVLSDGDATADATQMGGSVKQTVTVADMTNGLFSASNECTQAINAATWAKSAAAAPAGINPTEIYSISYGSETSGCSAGEGLTPCETMSALATPTAGSTDNPYFFSVPQTVKGVTSTVCTGAEPITQLSQVFTDIGDQFTTSRLIPNSVF